MRQKRNYHYDKNELAKLVLQGKSNKEIAEVLDIKEDTVRKRIMCMKKEGILPWIDRRTNEFKEQANNQRQFCPHCESCDKKCMEYHIVSVLVSNGIRLVK